MGLTRRQLLVGGAIAGAAALGGGWWTLGRGGAPALPRPEALDASAPSPAGSRRIEAVLVGSKQQIQTAATPESFAGAIRHWLADLPLTADVPRLIVFPEDVGLATAFIGSRGALARRLGSSTWAMASLLAAYLPEIAAAHDRFPRVPLPPNNLGLLWLALTDTMVSAFLGAFAPLARTYRSYVVAAMPSAPFAALPPSRPGGRPRYRATDSHVYNTAFVFNPDGDVVARVHKVHLVEVERTLLSLAAGKLEDLAPVMLPGIGSIGVVISKDAWMPDVLDRLAWEGAELLVQPDANNGFWATRPVLTNWQPDAWKAGNWVAVQKYAPFRYSLNPMMTGNLFDIPFDGQSALVAKVRPADVPLGYIGQAPDGGFMAVARWAAADPVRLPLPKRRRALAAVSRALAPGSSSPRKDRYGSARISARLAMVDASPRSSIVTSPTLRLHAEAVTSDIGWQPVMAADPGGGAYLAHVRPQGGLGRVALAVSPGPDISFRTLGWVDASASGGQWQPALAAGSDGLLYAAWIDDRTGSWEVRVAVSRDRGKTFGQSTPVAHATAQALATGPQLALAPDGALEVLWSDNRLPNAVGDVYRSVSRDGGRSFSNPIRVSDTPVHGVDGVPFGSGYGWNPHLLVRVDGRRVAIWQDFRPEIPDRPATRRNHIRIAEYGGGPPSPSHPVAPRPGVQQYKPRLIAAGPEPELAAWLEQRDDSAETGVALARIGPGGGALNPPPEVGREAREFDLAATPDGAVWLAWATSGGHLWVSRYSGERWTTHRIDWGFDRPVLNPALLAAPGNTLRLAWQTKAPSRVYCARLR